MLVFLRGMVQSNICDTPVARIVAESLGKSMRQQFVTGMHHTDACSVHRAIGNAFKHDKERSV